MIVEENLMVPMRDGVRLATDVYRPATVGQWPVLLTRVPYNKDLRFPIPRLREKRVFLELNLDVERAVQAGYVVIAQDTRGLYASEGEFTPLCHEQTDGADTIAWAASQPWSTGKVGMFGISYQGVTQRQAAGTQPAALQAIAPAQSPETTFRPYQGGALLLNVVLTMTLTQLIAGDIQRRIGQGRAMTAALEEIIQAQRNMQALYRQRPLIDISPLQQYAPYYVEWLTHPDDDAYWQKLVPEALYEQSMVPALTIAGWFDLFLTEDLAYYRNMKQRAGNALARQQQHLVIGPWSHGNFQSGFPERHFGEASAAKEMLTTMQIRWYDHWLKGIDNGIEQEKPVRLFVMGANVWREEEAWPLPDTQYRPYYLHSEGHANSTAGNGVLSPEHASQEPEDVYCYDPHHPVPTIGGAILGLAGPCDQRQVEAREDVLCYTTPPLTRPLEVTGPIELVLSVSSSAVDTDFTGKLVDVFPDGRAENLTDGILRARYRDSFAHPTLIEPGHIYTLHLDLGATSNVFRVGHRIRLEISSSNFPRFDRHTNTGGTLAAESAEACVQARNRVYHSDTFPSHLVLPIIEREHAQHIDRQEGADTAKGKGENRWRD
ncbi:X-Pro dipeptidyl-peptidase [Ktedonobacter sp. SOSP1-52]|uniref:CocE/NonD family hydrolase n=1 Tax=Ktedonobacter sp. SOSP1-52 TaxID=2778366 RepID=UPI001A2660B0|nr:CocE/NonD family hydrolase [Ktedonobacter sp. SOSP1-52]GHO63636.1 X-Pro dipeptidyl-peptidase [Ktedonobacter sp. SOSP1-52]